MVKVGVPESRAVSEADVPSGGVSSAGGGGKNGSGKMSLKTLIFRKFG
jgi:hypothetical protein